MIFRPLSSMSKAGDSRRRCQSRQCPRRRREYRHHQTDRANARSRIGTGAHRSRRRARVRAPRRLRRGRTNACSQATCATQPRPIHQRRFPRRPIQRRAHLPCGPYRDAPITHPFVARRKSERAILPLSSDNLRHLSAQRPLPGAA